MTIVSSILDMSRDIDSPRTTKSVMNHLIGEVIELYDEVFDNPDTRVDSDGILGEAVDVILCAVDIIHMQNPYITEEEIQEVVNRKLAKWQKLYGTGEVK